ncbi:TPA: hypothetical protein ACHGRA_003498 [Escherichia coli]
MLRNRARRLGYKIMR